MATGEHPDVALHLSVLEDRLAVCKLDPDQEVPDWATKGGFFSITRTPDELSIVCPEQNVPEGVLFEGGWRVIGIEGPLDFSLVGILASLLDPLAKAGISAFAISTYDTDYVVVRKDQLDSVLVALQDHGHEIVDT